ncbi:MAG TPA: hypothetical protein VIJ15_03940 [Dermatophilaceae bacterium]
MQRPPYPDPGVPDLRSPLRFLRWVAQGQRRALAGGVVFGVLWMVSQALFPAAVGQAIDLGIIAVDKRELLIWAGVLVALGVIVALSGAMRHRFAVENWLRASIRCMQLIGYRAEVTGEALPRRMPTGEVVATVASDSMRLGGLYDVSTEPDSQDTQDMRRQAERTVHAARKGPTRILALTPPRAQAAHR